MGTRYGPDKTKRTEEAARKGEALAKEVNSCGSKRVDPFETLFEYVNHSPVKFCDCGGFWQHGAFVHADTCERPPRRPSLPPADVDLSFAAYQADAASLGAHKTDPSYDQEKSLSVYAMGLAGETGEVVDHLKKVIGHGHDLDRDELTKELGDVLWYVAALSDVLQIPLDRVAKRNLEKLRKRYPNGFSKEASKNRKE